MKETIKSGLGVGLFALTMSAAFAGNLCTWKGGSGSLADDNWDVTPVSGNGDTLAFDTTDGQAITVEIPTDDFDVAGLKFANAAFLPIATSGVTQPGKITFTGKRLYVSGAAAAGTTVWDQGTDNANKRGPEIEVSAPLRFKGGRLAISWKTTFNGPVTIDDSGNLRLWWPINYSDAVGNFPPIVFNDVVYGPQATLDCSAGNGGRGSSIPFNGKVTLKKLYLNQGSLGKCTPALYASGNEIEQVYGRYANFECRAKDAISSNTLVSVYNCYGAVGFSVYADNTAKCVEHVKDETRPDQDASQPGVTDSKTGSTLTLRSDRSTEGVMRYLESINLVWDPLAAYTNTLVDSACTTKGRLEVKGGVVALKGSTSFSALTLLKIHSGGKLSVADSTAATPLPTTLPVRIFGTGKFVVPAERTLTVGTLIVRGVPVAADDYTAATADWVEGEGTVHVAGLASGTYWKAAVSGDWSDATKWTAGVPDATHDACLTAEGADYTVTIDASADDSGWPAKTTLVNEAGETVTLKLDRAKTFAQDNVFSFGRGSHAEITAQGVWKHENASKPSSVKRLIEVVDGASFEVKGTLNLTNLFELMVVESKKPEKSTLTVSGDGVLEVYGGDDTRGELRVNEGGKVVVKDSGAVKMPGVVVRSPLALNNGEIEVKDNGSWGGPQATWGTFTSFGSGTTRFTGNALFYSTRGRWDVRPTVDNVDADLLFEGNAHYRAGMLLRVGGRTSATGRVVYASSNQADNNVIGDYLMLGGQTGGVGEYVVRAGCHYLNGIGLKLGGDRETANASTGKPYPGDGRFVMEDGMFSVRGTWAQATRNQEYISGVLVGTSPYYTGYGPNVRKGELDIAGGFFESRDGFFIVGERAATGRVRQTGGRMENGAGISSQAVRKKIPLIIGFGGGDGSYELEGGVVTNLSPCYVGGAKTNGLLTTAWPATFAVHEDVATGALKIGGGIFSQQQAMYVGDDGTGTVAVVGATAKIDVDSLTLRNGAASTVKFVCGADGVSAVNVKGALAVSAGAKLVVDATACPADLKAVTLFTYDSCPDDFTDVRIIGGTSSAYVRRMPKRMVFRPQRNGSVILVR